MIHFTIESLGVDNMGADSVEQIINTIRINGHNGVSFEVTSDCPEKGTYVKFDGKYRRVEDAPES